jgi:hypothetical protein
MQSLWKRVQRKVGVMETQEKIVLKIDLAFEGIRNLNEQINQKKDLIIYSKVKIAILN